MKEEKKGTISLVLTRSLLF